MSVSRRDRSQVARRAWERSGTLPKRRQPACAPAPYEKTDRVTCFCANSTGEDESDTPIVIE
jgi:hypothetical protein